MIKDNYTQNDLKNISAYYSSGGFDLVKERDEIISMCGYIQKDHETVELKRLRIRYENRKRGYGRIKVT